MKPYDVFRVSKNGDYFLLERSIIESESPFFQRWPEFCTFKRLMMMVDLKTLNPKIKINATNIGKAEWRSPKTIRQHLRFLVGLKAIKKKYGEVEILNLDKYMVD